MEGENQSEGCYKYPDGCVDRIFDTVPCRRSQTRLLLSLFGAREHAACPAVFVYGHASTGKTMLLKTIMATLQVPHVYINCVESFGSRLMYEKILNDLSSSSGLKCDNMNDFVRSFKHCLQENSLDKETVYIVFDKAERLRDMDINLLPAFLRLQELTEMNVCIVLISEIVWEKFQSGTGYYNPLVINFLDYTKDELTDVMCLDCPKEYTLDFYSSYIRLVLSIFHQACRDLRELRHLALLNFPKYIEPILNEEATCDNTHKLWRNIEPHLKKALQTVYLREVSSSFSNGQLLKWILANTGNTPATGRHSQWERLQQGDTNLPLQGLSARTHIELPFFTKYLLIAAYLASYNPAKSDKRFFANKTGKITRREKLIKKHERTTNHLLGPKPFPLDRLLAIFYSVVEEKVAPTANIFMQISSLVTLHLLTQVAGDDQLDSPKYKCLVSLDFMLSVCRTVGFDIKRYLYDFL